MKTHRLVSFALALSVLVLVPGLWAKEAKVEFKVSGMTCEMCAKGVEAQLKKLDGVKSATVSYKESRATVVYDDTQVTPEKLKETIEKSGFKAELKSADSTSGSAPKQKGGCCH